MQKEASRGLRRPGLGDGEELGKVIERQWSVKGGE